MVRLIPVGLLPRAPHRRDKHDDTVNAGLNDRTKDLDAQTDEKLGNL